MGFVRAAFTAALMSAAFAHAEEFPLEIKVLAPEEAFALPALLTTPGMWTAEKPPQVLAEKPAISPRPLYAVFTMPRTGAMAARMDQSQRGGAYDRLILDLNCNGDLGDDPEVGPASPATHSSSNTTTYFGPIAAAPLDRPGAPAMALCVRTSVRSPAVTGGGGLGTAYLQPASWMQARVNYNGEDILIALLDADCNLRLGDTRIMELQKQSGQDRWAMIAGDTLYRDRNNSGMIEFNTLGLEGEPLGPIVYFGSQPCNLEITPDGRSLRVEPCAAPLGRIAAAHPEYFERLTLGRKVGENSWEVVTIRPDDGQFNAPEGDYVMFRFVAQGARDGDVWATAGTKWTPEAGDYFSVRAGEAAELAAGLPLRATLTVDRVHETPGGLLTLLTGPGTIPGGAINLNLAKVGAAGEEVLWFIRNDKLEPPGQFTIRDESGNVIATGQFEYG